MIRQRISTETVVGTVAPTIWPCIRRVMPEFHRLDMLCIVVHQVLYNESTTNRANGVGTLVNRTPIYTA